MKKLVAIVLALPLLAQAEEVPPFHQTVEQRLQPQIEALLAGLVKDGRALTMDGVQVFNGEDKFLPGKIAISLVEFLLSLPPDDPRLPGYLKNFRQVAKLTADDANDTWGAYYYMVALDRLRQAGLLQNAIDRLTLAKLRVKLDWRMFVDPDNFDLIDHPNNYYVVALGIARLRQAMGWEDGAGAARIYDKVAEHYRRYGMDFADETDGEGRFDRYSILLSAELAHHFLETGGRPPAEVLGWLRKSAELMLMRAHADGSGFEYGRSLGPYGETAIIEVLTSAAALDLLSEEEKALAYSYCSRAANRYFTFWTNKTTGSVDLWDNGRRTDDYRGKFRILGENLSLAHQYAYTDAMWSAMGWRDKPPLSDFAAAQNKLPSELVTWFVKGDYDRMLLTRRDRGHVIGLPLINGGVSQHMHSPYFPIPFARDLISGVADGSKPLLVPQVMLADGSVLMPLAYMRDIKVTQQKGKTIVTYRQSELDRMGKPGPVPDDRMSSQTTYVFESGRITRTDVITPKAPLDIQSMHMDLASFQGKFSVSGIGDCKSETLHLDRDYESDIGPLPSKTSCADGPRHADAPFTISWTFTYD